jgi:hypothetical protein
MFQKIILFLLAIIIFNAVHISPQTLTRTSAIPINGFCRYKTFNTSPDYSSIFSFNYNNDSYSDILLYSPLKRKVNILTGSENGEFKKQDSIKVPFQFSELQTIYDKGEETGEYAFVSRRDREAGIFQISNSGKFALESSISFSSYPENISAADVNSDGKQEFLISGSAFDGLSLIFRNNKKLSEKKIEQREVYTDAVFVDLNNDGIPDIAGFDLITNSINLFYNYGNGEFSKIRSIPVDEKINTLQSFDMNSDSYEDLIFVKENSIIIFYNDFRSSFDNYTTINTLYFPDKIITGDFNKDGRIDIAYINYEQETLSVIFGKSDLEFYPETVYMKKNGIEDIIPFYSKFINGIAGVSSKGEIFTITRLSSFSENVQLVLGAEPSAVAYFDNDDNGIIDFCFLDNSSNSLIAVIRNNAGIPYYYYSFSLFQDHSIITPFNISSNVKGFCCYSLGRKLIEVIVINFSKGEFERRTLYSHGDIQDLKVLKDNENKMILHAAYKINYKAGIDLFKYSDHYFSNENYYITVKDLFSNISLGSRNSIYFWQKEGRKLNFIFNEFNDVQNHLKEKISLSLQKYPAENKAVVFTGDLLNKDKDISISFFSSRKDTFAVISSANKYSVLGKNNRSENLNVQNYRQLFFGQMRFNGLKKLFIYNPQKRKVDKIDFLNEGKDFISTKIADAVNLNSYFIKNMNFKNFHILFTKKNSSLISIKKLSQ